ncbi:unnamed protein product [Ceutorhynchus assimilis]|uniref:Enoyl-CoA hydratase n=1 Tax=Ceutorhynchus assimilis TaxID=467358 RepID=A0A9N9QND8_9CUCU|nr:unnamed protein product [Ceutorhynchus assimilis]
MLSRRIINSLCKSMSTKAKDKNNILVEKMGLITTIGINRPDKRNCIDKSTSEMLEAAISSFERDPSASVAVLYGTGGNFCSGFDLAEIAENEKLNCSLLPSKKTVNKPMIAALSGYTVAGGLELALLCDLRVMEETAIVGLYGRRFGVPLVDGATVRLPAVIGLSRALDLILTGRTLTAKEAFEWGLANRIVACGTGFGQALQLATCLTKFPQDCLNSDRNSTYNAAFNQVYDELLKYEKEKAKSLKVKDIIEGAKKFLSGIGKHGKSYNLKEKESFEWEKEYDKAVKSKL